jgi:hypothetical protein
MKPKPMGMGSVSSLNEFNGVMTNNKIVFVEGHI